MTRTLFKCYFSCAVCLCSDTDWFMLCTDLCLSAIFLVLFVCVQILIGLCYVLIFV